MITTGFPFTKEQITQIREAHTDIIWEAHQNQIEDVEAFEEYMNKLASVHTIATMLLIEKDREERNGIQPPTDEVDGGQYSPI